MISQQFNKRIKQETIYNSMYTQREFIISNLILDLKVDIYLKHFNDQQFITQITLFQYNRVRHTWYIARYEQYGTNTDQPVPNEIY